MLTNPSSRLGPSLVSLKVQLPCAPRCAVTPTPLLSHRRVQPTNLKAFHPTLSLSLRRQSPTNKARCASSLQLVRLASTSASSPAPAPTTTSAAQPSTTVTWNDYLALRKTRRRYNLAASFLTSVGTTSVGVTVMSQQNFEHLGGLFGLDPFIVLGLATAGSGALGWLLGPFVGNAVFGMVHRRVGGQIAEKEKDFYRRIRRYRVDPSSQSFANPVPDYYGEKIGSVSEFRHWMKDQRAYNKKRQSFL